MKKLMTALAITTALAGCATTTGAHPDARTRGYSPAKIVEIRPH